MGLSQATWSWLLWTFCAVNLQALEIHDQLTSHERLLMFGTHSASEVPVYHLTFARRHAVQKRSLLPNRDLFYNLTVEGTDRTLHIRPNPTLISKHFVLKPDGLGVDIAKLGECLFQGKFTSGPGRAAISICGELGLTGMIETESGRRYQLHPLPARFQENITEQGHKQLLVLMKNESVNNDTFCGVTAELNAPQRLVVTGDSPVDLSMTSSRRRRDIIPDKLYIETAVFADYMLYKTLVGKTLLHDHDAFVKFILAIVNTVQLVYNEPSLGRSVEIVLVRLEILQNENLPFYNEEVDKYLWDFCKWQSNLNPGTDLSTPNHWDHAIILTGFDLKSGSLRSVTGYAPVGGMCNPLYSCTINEGNHFGAAFVIAHEMGHSLTMQHDGQAGVSGNGCDAQRHLMSPSTGRGKTTWSTCSRNYLDGFLGSTQSQCLKDIPPGHPLSVDLPYSELPGQLYPADEQCKLLYGLEFHRYASQPNSDVCEILICANTTVYITGHPALPGTFCGEGHWCSGGACVPWGSAGPAAIDGGWSPWPTTAECVSECLVPGTGLRVFERSCTVPVPANGGKLCEGKAKRYQTCPDAVTCTARSVQTIPAYANQQCLKTKTLQSDLTLTGSGRQRLQDPTGGCVIWCDTFQGGYKTWGAKFPDGTDCGGGLGKAYCVEGQCRGFGCDGWTLDESAADSCRNASTPETTISDSGTDLNSSVALAQPAAVPPTYPSFLVPKVLLFPTGGLFSDATKSGWGDWEKSGPCVSNCLRDSAALQKVVRKCGGSCSGRNSTVSLCSMACPNVFYTADTYVTKICTALKTVDQTLTGLGKQLSHIPDDPRQSCKLWCQASSTLRSWPEMYFPDGTLCAFDGVSKSYCVKGSCTRFSCDGMPADSSDPAKCEQPLGLKMLLPGKPRAAAGGKHSMIAQPQSGQISNDTAGRFQWMTVSTPCSHPCGGGTRKNHVLCVTAGRARSKHGQKVDETMCDMNLKQTVVFEESCNTQACPQWSTSKWSDCTGTCGNATTIRLVQCVLASPPVGTIEVETIVDDSLCDTILKPTISQTCTQNCEPQPPMSYF